MKKLVLKSPHRRAIHLLAIATVLGLASVGLSQCRMVSDNVTGVELTPETLHKRNNCTRKCNNAYQDAIEKEDRRYKDAVRRCSTRRCKDAERDKHEAIQDKLKAERKKCKKGCYNEGGGHGGR
jgi:hypothetical protein